MAAGARPIAGIFVGGQGRRMNGLVKGLLRAPSGEGLVQRWCRLFETLEIDVVLVGEGIAYAALGLEHIPDVPGGIGPLGGLVALLAHARGRDVIAVACDMPFVSAPLIRKLAQFDSQGPVVSALRDGRWEPFFARYRGDQPLARAREQAASGHHSLQRLLETLGALRLPLADDEAEQLRDWDEPGDIGA